MRKISLLGLCALWTGILLSQQEASAWINFKFGAGVNWNWQAGGNNFFWGLFRNGQPPGYGNCCDPSCLRIGCQPCCQPQCCPPQYIPQCNPFMYQQWPCQQCPGCLPNCPSFGAGNHYCPNEFQYFGNQPNAETGNPLDPARQNALAQSSTIANWQSGYVSPYGTAAYCSNPYIGNYCSYPYCTTSNYSYPTSSVSNYSYPYTTASYYSYPASSTSYYSYPYSTANYYSYPAGSASYYYYPYYGSSSYSYPRWDYGNPYGYYCYGR